MFTVDIFQNLDVCLIPLTVKPTSAWGVQSFSVLLRNELCTQLSVLQVRLKLSSCLLLRGHVDVSTFLHLKASFPHV